MPNNIRWVIFDLGGVVVKLNIDGALLALTQQSETDPEVIKAYLSAPDESGFSINARLELGLFTASDYVRQVAQILNKPLNHEEIIALKMLIIQGEDAQMLDLLAALSKQKKLACFSNTHEIHWNHMTQHYRAFQFFEKTIASHLIRAAKPDWNAFALATEYLNADPQECLFIDDLLANAEAARAFGWNAIHFQNHAALREELRQYDIVV
ncbi:MAG: HAD family phosphatase [Blastocatellia bacterium]|nr:HAD family phosphatase [Blastocatellia bacterium]